MTGFSLVGAGGAQFQSSDPPDGCASSFLIGLFFGPIFSSVFMCTSLGPRNKALRCYGAGIAALLQSVAFFSTYRYLSNYEDCGFRLYDYYDKGSTKTGETYMCELIDLGQPFLYPAIIVAVWSFLFFVLAASARRQFQIVISNAVSADAPVVVQVPCGQVQPQPQQQVIYATITLDPSSPQFTAQQYHQPQPVPAPATATAAFETVGIDQVYPLTNPQETFQYNPPSAPPPEYSKI